MTEIVKVDAKPTKQFFIDMITRDISLLRAILDLIDNCVDAGRREGDMSSLLVEVKFDKDSFKIKDNCGGFDRETAEKYAFRFGRDTGSPGSPNSVGQFGVGLKRTLFKLGNIFEVSSKTVEPGFTVSCDVNAWIAISHWEFDISSVTDDLEIGETMVKVKELSESSSRILSQESFSLELIKEIGLAHYKALNDGMVIKVNGTAIVGKKISIKSSALISATFIKTQIEGVDIVIRAGVADRDYNLGGWYVCCNGRLVLDADQTEATGWGGDLPKYHPNYAFFRGVVEFTAETSSLLPWTTTKTGVDTDHRIYQIALNMMNEVSQGFIGMLRERASEVSDKEKGVIDETPINNAILAAPLLDLYDLPINEKMNWPEKVVRPKREKYVSVQYHVAERELNIAKDFTGESSARQVGLYTFEYYFTKECEDE